MIPAELIKDAVARMAENAARRGWDKDRIAAQKAGNKGRGKHKGKGAHTHGHGESSHGHGESSHGHWESSDGQRKGSSDGWEP